MKFGNLVVGFFIVAIVFFAVAGEWMFPPKAQAQTPIESDCALIENRSTMNIYRCILPNGSGGKKLCFVLTSPTGSSIDCP